MLPQVVAPYSLVYKNDHLTIIKTEHDKVAVDYCVDFGSGHLAYRSHRQRMAQELIIKAHGLNKNSDVSILDATCGFARDAFLLANAGARVTMLEQDAVVAALVQDGIRRAFQTDDASLGNVMRRMQLLPVSLEYFYQHNATQFDIVYLDPMFPTARKSALVKKDMQVLRDLVNNRYAIDGLCMMQIAAKIASKKIIVKRHVTAPYLADLPPRYNYANNSIRYDVYLPLECGL